MPRNVVIAAGSFQFHPVNDPRWSRRVNVCSNKFNAPGVGGGNASGNLHNFLNDLADLIDRRILDKTASPRPRPRHRDSNNGITTIPATFDGSRGRRNTGAGWTNSWPISALKHRFTLKTP